MKDISLSLSSQRQISEKIKIADYNKKNNNKLPVLTGEKVILSPVPDSEEFLTDLCAVVGIPFTLTKEQELECKALDFLFRFGIKK